MPLLFIEPTTENIIPTILWMLCGLVVAEGMALVYLIRQKGRNGHGNRSGDLDPAVWKLTFSEIAEKVADDKLIPHLETIESEIKDLGERVHKIRNSLLVLRGMQEERDSAQD